MGGDKTSKKDSQRSPKGNQVITGFISTLRNYSSCMGIHFMIEMPVKSVMSPVFQWTM